MTLNPIVWSGYSDRIDIDFRLRVSWRFVWADNSHVKRHEQAWH